MDAAGAQCRVQHHLTSSLMTRVIGVLCQQVGREAGGEGSGQVREMGLQEPDGVGQREVPRNGPRHHNKLEPTSEKALRVLLSTRLTRSQQCALVAEVANSLLSCVRRCCQQVEGGDPAPLLSPGVDTDTWRKLEKIDHYKRFAWQILRVLPGLEMRAVGVGISPRL